MALTPMKLPKKESDLLRTVISCFDGKKYDKGIKAVDQILEKFPNNGEALAMKGLLYNSIGRKEEAYELVRLGVKNDIKSHTCWHVFGLIYKSDSNYKEASKCYLNALRIDSTNQNLYRDLSSLQLHTRDYPGFIETRRKMLTSKPSLRLSWIGYAAANYFGGEYELAVDVLNNYQTATDDKGTPYEEGEVYLVQSKCYEKLGRYQDAYSHLQQNQSKIVDKLACRISCAELLVYMKKFTEAKAEWLSLVSDQPDNYCFHRGLQITVLELTADVATNMFALKRLDLPSNVLKLSMEQVDKLTMLYKNEIKANAAAKKILLSLASTGINSSSSGSSNSFALLIDDHLRKSLSEGIPALYQDILYLIRKPCNSNDDYTELIINPNEFRQHSLVQMIADLIDGYIRNLSEDLPKFDSSDSVVQSPTTLLWALYLKAQLLESCGMYETALQTVTTCIGHSPTALDMYILKAKLLSIAGDNAGAASTMEHCRKLDLQDRYLNNMSTKYLLRANCIKQAIKTVSFFTKDGDDPLMYLFDLQCHWFEIESADAYAKLKKWSLALKNYSAILKHFTDYCEDVFEFHLYVLRKTTLRAHGDMLDMLDKAYTHAFYTRASKEYLKILLHLLDHPEDVDGLGHLSAAERKKERVKLKKLKAKEAQANLDGIDALNKSESAAAASGKSDEDETSGKKKKDADPLGEKLFETISKDVIGEAYKCALTIVPHARLIVDVELLAFVGDVMIRKGKLVIATKAVCCGLARCPDDPSLLPVAIKLYQSLSIPVNSKKAVYVVCLTELKEMMKCNDATAYLNEYIAKNIVGVSSSVSSTISQRVAVAKSYHHIDKTTVAKTAAIAILSDDCMWNCKTATTLPEICEALIYIEEVLAPEYDVSQFKTNALSIYPLATGRLTQCYEIQEYVEDDSLFQAYQ